MGAELWYHDVPWRPDPAAALREFQADFFRSRYNFTERFQSWATSTRNALKSERKSGDEYGLVEIYEKSAKVIRKIESETLPTDPLEQIAVLRRVIATQTPDGFRNILDVTGVNDEGGTHVTRRLGADEVCRMLGTDRPTLEQATAAVSRIAGEIGRSESVCFEHFGDGAGQPARWFFFGYTHD